MLASRFFRIYSDVIALIEKSNDKTGEHMKFVDQVGLTREEKGEFVDYLQTQDIGKFHFKTVIDLTGDNKKVVTMERSDKQFYKYELILYDDKDRETFKLRLENKKFQEQNAEEKEKLTPNIFLKDYVDRMMAQGAYFMSVEDEGKSALINLFQVKEIVFIQKYVEKYEGDK